MLDDSTEPVTQLVLAPMARSSGGNNQGSAAVWKLKLAY